MTTKYLSLDKDNFKASVLREAADIIRSGGLVAFPTETVYGLGADALNYSAAEKIYEAKGRPSNNPLIVHISRVEDAEKYVVTDDRYYKIAQAFMPGPITVIMPSKKVVADSVCASLDTLAIRCPSHPIARAFIEMCDRPIAAPSANTSGRPSPTTAEHVRHDLDGRVDMIIDGGECEVGLESTIIKLDRDKVLLLRPGGVTYEMLTDLLGEVEIAHGVTEKPDSTEKIESPGMLISHYAPAAPLYLVKGDEGCIINFLNDKMREKDSYVISFDGIFPYSEQIISLGDKDNRCEAAHRLFAALREADELGAKQIYAPYPDRDGIGLALLNRMLRAAAFRIIEV